MAKIERSVFIEAREWFDKINGNSYFTAQIQIDNKLVATIPFTYGYGNQYQYEAQKVLQNMGYLPKVDSLHIAHQCEDLGVDFYTVKSITKKRDMFK